MTSNNMSGRFDLFSIRTIKYFICWLLLWQDSMVPGSALQLSTYVSIPLPGVRMLEFYTFILVAVLLIERTLQQDFSIRRSYYSAPLVLLLFAFALSWTRGSFINQRFSPVLEIHEAFEWPFAFFVMINTFRDAEDREVLWKLIISAVIPKSIEGVYIYYFVNDPAKYWGVVQLWRDAYLLGIGAASLMLFAHYRGKNLRRIKWALFLAIPVMGFTFIMSFRRTFLLSAMVSMMLMFVTLPSKLRKRHFAVAFGFLGFLVLSAMMTDPLALLGRLGGIFAPQTEGSAFIRLLEWPNVIQNIIHNPIFGTPVGVPWKVYYRMPLSADYTTLGTHNTYFYYPLRAGLFGIAGFFWLLGRMWKAALINYTLHKNEDDFVFGQLGIHMLILFNVSCFFGLMYAENLPVFMGVVMTVFQLQTKHVTGRYSLKEVALLQTMRAKRLVYKRRYAARLTTAVVPQTIG